MKYTRFRHQNDAHDQVLRPYRTSIISSQKSFLAVTVQGFAIKGKDPIKVSISRPGFADKVIFVPIGAYGVYYDSYRRRKKIPDPSYLSWVEKNFLPMAMPYLTPALKAWEDSLSTGEVASKASSHERQMSDCTVPGYNKRRRAGEVFFNPMVSSNTSIDIIDPSILAPVNAQFKELVPGSTFDGDGSYYANFETTVNPTFPLDSLASHSYLSDLLFENEVVNSQDAINSAYGSINVGQIQSLVMLGEARETIRHLVLTIGRFAKIARALKKGKWSSLAPKTLRKYRRMKLKKKSLSLLDFFSEAWLEARYAWRPLIMDAVAAKKLLNGEDLLLPRQTFRGYSSSESSDSGEFTFPNEIGESISVTYDRSSTAFASAGVLCQASSDIPTLSQPSGANLVDAGWDLVPFSFVVDWFVNLGGLLYNLRPSGSYSVLGSWVSITYQNSISGTLTITHLDGSEQTATFSGSRTTKSREVGREETLFSLSLDLDFSQMIDSVALLRVLRR